MTTAVKEKGEDKVVCSDADGTFSVQLERWERREMKAATRRKIPKDPQISTKRKRNFRTGRVEGDRTISDKILHPDRKSRNLERGGRKGLAFQTVVTILL